jgi:hypothetical protein
MGEFGVGVAPAGARAGDRHLHPMKIGDAVVYVEQTGPTPEVESTEFYPATSLDPADAFQKASEAIRECVRIVGERVKQLAEDAKPEEIAVEFTLGFEAKGRASFIPILVQAEASANTALKVTAVWRSEPSAGRS